MPYGRRGRRRGRKRKLERREPEVDQESDNAAPSEEASCLGSDYKYSRIAPLLTFASQNDSENMFSRAYVKPSPSLSECLFADDDKSDEVEIEVTDKETTVDVRSSNNSASTALNLKPSTSFEGSINSYVKPASDGKQEPRSGAEGKSKEQGSSKSEEGTSQPVTKSLFVRNENPSKKPWIKKRAIPSSDCIPMTESEESACAKELEKKICEGQQVSIADIRLHRKLKVRQELRDRGLPVFDPHSNVNGFWTNIRRNDIQRTLDRFQNQNLIISSDDHQNSFRTRILGYPERYMCFVSPYSKSVLKPFIIRDYESTPLWLTLMDELKTKANKKDPTWVPPPRAPIDYCYVRPHHVPAINSLAEQYFWPGINLAECLRYPDFSCIVFYKKLLIGFVFAMPEAARNEVYISYMVVRREWQRSGIGSIMLFHIIETCKGKDLTLHVSPTNPALILYQKFGFKVVRFERNFYLRYMPYDSKQNKHAFFMRCEDVVGKQRNIDPVQRAI